MRKLAVVMFSFAAAIAIAVYLLPDDMALIFAGIFAAVGAASLLMKSEKRFSVMLTAFGLAVGMLWYFVYGLIFLTPADILDGKTETVQAEISSFPEETEYGSRTEIKVMQEGYHSVKTRLYIYDDVPDVKPGDKIAFTGDFTSSDKLHGKDTNSFTSKGYFLFAYISGDIEVENGDKADRAKYFPQYMANALKEKINEIFPEDIKGFVMALLTGDDRLLEENSELNHALSITGVYHVVAVSGMHLAYLVSIIGIFIKKKRIAAIVTVPVMLLFMAMVGFTPSVTRAGIMQLFIISASMLKRESDPLTALASALGIILMFNPYAIAHVGLQLSFGASLGIILFTGKMYDALYKKAENTKLCRYKFGKAAWKFVLSNFSVTVGASVITLPLIAVYFGYVSLIAPITNIVVLWAVSLAFSLSAAACMLGFIFAPLGIIAAYAAALPAGWFIVAVRLLAKLKFAAVYTSNMFFVGWIVFVYLAGIAFVMLKCRLRQLIFPASLAAISLCVIFLLSAEPIGSAKLEFTALNVGQGQSLVITKGDKTAVIDCGSSSGEDAGKTAADFLISQQRNEIDVLILTHFHADHANGVEKLMEMVQVNALLVPDPSLSENYYSEDIIKLARRRGIDIIYVTKNAEISLGSVSIDVFAPLTAGGENENGLCILCSEREYDILVTGDINANLERQLIAREDIPDTELLVVGHHGSKYSTCDKFLDETAPENAIISVGENTYGHPAEETLKRLKENGIEVYRTDELGNITISAG